MREISELLDRLENQLEQRADVAKTTTQPEYPTAIIYAGRRSLEAQADIEQTLHRVWRVRADAVRHFMLDRGAFSLCSGSVPMQVLPEPEIIEQIEGMFGSDQCFNNLTGLFLCLVQDTAQYQDAEEFYRDYRELDRFAKQFDVKVNTMKLLLLDESNKGKVLSEQIRAFLRSEISGNAGSSRTTVLLSSRLSSGQLLKNQLLRENYILAGNLILIANGCSGTYTPAYSTMFPINGTDLLTASYSRLTRPNRDICEVMVNTLLEWMSGQFARGEVLKVSDISARLGITGGILKTMSDSFRRQTPASIVSRETLDCLPRSTAELGSIGDLPFDRFDNMTMGSFELFFQMNLEPACRAEGSVDLFRQEFRRFAASKFKPREAAYSLTPQNIDAVLSEIHVSDPPRSASAYLYMCKRMEVQYYRTMLPVCREVLLEISREAREYIECLQSLIDSFNRNYMLNVEPTVQTHYEPLVKQSLNGELGMALADLLDRERMDDEQLLTALFDTLSRIISSQDIFTMTLAGEMEKRLGGNMNTMQTTVKQILLDRLSDKIRLKSAISPNKCMDIMMLDTKCSVFDFMKTMYPDMVRMDTGNGSAVELIQFFRVGQTTI